MGRRKYGLIIAILLLIAGALICGATLASVGFDFSRLDPDNMLSVYTGGAVIFKSVP